MRHLPINGAALTTCFLIAAHPGIDRDVSQSPVPGIDSASRTCMVKTAMPCALRCATVVLALGTSSAHGLARGPGIDVCKPSGAVVPLADLSEASGLAARRQSDGGMWSLNDSGAPMLVALDSRGKTTARVRIDGARVEDWEAVATGACPSGSCVFIADIGDNAARRTRITIYRVPEPRPSAVAASATEAFHATYPEGPQDAETLLVAPAGRMYVVTKGGETGPVALYAFPAALQSKAPVKLTRIGAGNANARVTPAERITDGAVSPNGRWVVLRTLATLHFYRAQDLFAGNWKQSYRVDLAALKEPQGEGVTFVTDTTLALAGEGETKGDPGTLTFLTCTLE
jgi:hypothetical protein